MTRVKSITMQMIIYLQEYPYMYMSLSISTYVLLEHSYLCLHANANLNSKLI